MSGVSCRAGPVCSEYVVTAGNTDASMFCVQIMADALTMWEELGKIDNTKVGYVLCFSWQIKTIAAVVTFTLLWTLA